MRSILFYELSNNIKPKINIIRNSIILNEKLRNLPITTIELSGITSELKELLRSIPTDKEDRFQWSVYENCAVITKLYAIYESFVEQIITTWIKELPSLVPQYSDLDEKFKENYIINLGQILINKKKQKFQNLKIENIISGLYYGVKDNKTQELLIEAFILHERNLRKEDLEKLFKNCELHENAWTWISNNHFVENFVTEKIVDTTAESLLKKLIDLRNNAAHLEILVDNIYGSEELLELCDFIENICCALSELATYQLLLKQESQGKIIKIGYIAEWFKNPQAGVAKINNTKIKLGDILFLSNNSNCQIAKIISLQVDNIDRSEINISLETEIGIKFNVNAKEKMDIYQAKSNYYNDLDS